MLTYVNSKVKGAFIFMWSWTDSVIFAGCDRRDVKLDLVERISVMIITSFQRKYMETELQFRRKVFFEDFQLATINVCKGKYIA